LCIIISSNSSDNDKKRGGKRKGEKRRRATDNFFPHLEARKEGKRGGGKGKQRVGLPRRQGGENKREGARRPVTNGGRRKGIEEGKEIAPDGRASFMRVAGKKGKWGNDTQECLSFGPARRVTHGKDQGKRIFPHPAKSESMLSLLPPTRKGKGGKGETEKRE